MIIQSLLDTDHYKITMGQVIFHRFPRAQARYEFINRGKTPFPEGFGAQVARHVQELADLRLTPTEADWLRKRVDYFKPTYLEWLANYRFDPREVSVGQVDGVLSMDVAGPWYRTVFWEVPLLALVSELYFGGTAPASDWRDRIHQKAERLSAAGVQWVDFGTRRRFSYEVQRAVNDVMRDCRPLYLGTSNPYLAMMYDLPPVGTYAHEAPMAMQALVGFSSADRVWMEAWQEEYQGELGIALTDTLTTRRFLSDVFEGRMARLFDGVRQDSGDPAAVAEMVIAHYEKLGIDPRSRRIMFSDSLTDQKLIALHERFRDRIEVAGGIGTFLTNDMGARPLNIVIKMTAADFGHGWVPVIKLSDDPGKQSGDAARVALARQELGV
jgi:nicotinate phosphoribosyltransferase